MLQASRTYATISKLSSEFERSSAPSWLRWIRSPTALVLVLLLLLLRWRCHSTGIATR